MNNALFPILAAATVALMAWGIVQILLGFTDERKRITDRLTGENKGSGTFDPAAFTVVRRDAEFHGFSATLAKAPFLYRMGRDLMQIWPNTSLAKFCFIMLGCGFMGFVAALGVSGTFMIGAIGGLIGLFLPRMVLNAKRNGRQKEFLEQLPEALDFLSRVLRAGHSLSTGLQMMADELPQPIAGEFRKCYDAHSVGQSLEEALKDAAIRVDNADFGFFVTAILIQRQTGGDLSEVLNNIGDMIRQRIRLQQHVKAKTAEGRFTGYVLVALPILLFFCSYYLAPDYPSVLLHTRTGIYLLFTAAGMLSLGIWSIRKITTIKV